ncbi:MAG: HIT family protein [Bacteroidales bacterium]|nr:HIT family protein [Bacteroidales bacterium]
MKYTHSNTNEPGKHTSGKNNLPCPFCHPDLITEPILESDTAFAIFDKYPVSDGHALVIPRRHCSSYFGLTTAEQAACWQLLNDVAAIIRERFNPDGFNIGINIGHAAGQTIDHVHLHLIPRYDGDVEEPEGGVRGVIPWKRAYF